MTIRLLAATAAAALLLSAPARAQAPDFGDDASQWSNDGECDDPRFEGAGMTQTPLIEADSGHDATDCRAAFEAGTITVVGGTTTTTQAPPVKGAPAPAPSPAPSPAPAPTPAPAPGLAGAVEYGDDSSQWAGDGECDDRRFTGPGMATAGLSWTNAGHDASDCRALVESGQVRLWDLAESRAATQCAAIDFGDDSGEYASDGECDDARFEGLGMATTLNPNLVGRDATDCSARCALGMVGLRDY